MDVRILQRFRDGADYSKVYLVGETVTFDDERAEYLIGLGLVERTEGAKPKARTAARRKAASKIIATE